MSSSKVTYATHQNIGLLPHTLLPSPASKLKQSVNELHFASSVFVSRCNIYSLRRDGKEHEATSDLASVLRRVKAIISNTYQLTPPEERAKSFNQLSAQSYALVAKWKVNVVEGCQLDIMNTHGSAHQVRSALNELLDDFIMAFDEYMSFINDLANKASTKGQTIDLSKAQKNIRDSMNSFVYRPGRVEADMKAKQVSNVKLNDKLSRAKSSPMLNKPLPAVKLPKAESPLSEQSIISAYEESVFSVETNKTMFRHNQNQWNINDFHQSMQSLKDVYEKDMSEKKKKQEKLMLMLHMMAKSPPTPLTAQDKDLGQSAPGQQTNSNKKETEAIPLQNLQINQEVGVPMLKRAKSAILHERLKAEARKLAKITSNPMLRFQIEHEVPPMPDKSKSMQLLVPPKEGSKSVHQFQKIGYGVFKDIKRVFKSAFTTSRTLKKSASTNAIDRHGQNIPHLPSYATHDQWRCGICCDSLILNGQKVQCQKCGVVMHKTCQDQADLSTWACV